MATAEQRRLVKILRFECVTQGEIVKQNNAKISHIVSKTVLLFFSVTNLWHLLVAFCATIVVGHVLGLAFNA